jgi:hypothetical protein
VHAWCRAAYLGVSPAYFGQKADACGRCITLQCDDASCAQAGKTLPALVADVCGEGRGVEGLRIGGLLCGLDSQ